MEFTLFDGDEEFEIEADGEVSVLELQVVIESGIGAVIVRHDAAIAIRRRDGWHRFRPVTRSGTYSFELPRKAAKGT